MAAQLAVQHCDCHYSSRQRPVGSRSTVNCHVPLDRNFATVQRCAVRAALYLRNGREYFMYSAAPKGGFLYPLVRELLPAVQ